MNNNISTDAPSFVRSSPSTGVTTDLPGGSYQKPRLSNLGSVAALTLGTGSRQVPDNNGKVPRP